MEISVIRFLIVFVVLGLASLPAQAQQAVKQAGTITPGHATMWGSPGVIMDGGTAAAGFLTSLGVTNNGGPGICLNSAPITSPFNQMCLSVTTNGGAKISSYTYGGAVTPGITFDINGSTQGFPVVTLSVNNNESACFDGTTGAIKHCTFTSHGVLLGQNTSVVTTALPGAAGTALVSNGVSSDPSFQVPPFGPILNALCASAAAIPIYSPSAWQCSTAGVSNPLGASSMFSASDSLSAYIFRGSDPGSHNGAKHNLAIVEHRPIGSGANGPNNADFGLAISAQKQNFASTSVVGEVDGVYTIVRNGGAGSDAVAYLGDVGHYGTGFSSLLEGVTQKFTSPSTTNFQVRTQIGVIDNVNNNKFGYSANAEVGALDAGFWALNTGASTWTNFFRGTTGGVDRFTVASDGKLTVFNNTSTSGITGATIDVTQTQPNAGDTNDSALSTSYVLSANSATNELIARVFKLGATNNLTGGGAISNFRVFDLTTTTNASTITGNLESIYLETLGTSGTVTTGYGLHIASLQGATKWGIADDSGANWYNAAGGLALGATSAAGNGNLTATGSVRAPTIGTASGALAVNPNNGHVIVTGGSQLTNSACTGFALGTGSTDTAGKVSYSSATTCTINFGTAFANAPFCVVSPGSAASTHVVTTSTTQLAVTFGTAQTAFFYHCFGA